MISDLFFQLNWKVQSAIRRSASSNYFRELIAENGLTPVDWTKRNQERLRSTLKWATEKIPFYKDKFGDLDVKSNDDKFWSSFQSIPVLTKRDLVEHGADLVDSAVNETGRIANATGGSTGQPVTFWQDPSYREIAAAIERFVNSWWGVQPWDRTAIVWGADRDIKTQGWRTRFYEWRARRRILNAFKINENEMEEFCQMLGRWRPPQLVGYASALAKFAEYALQKGHTGLRFKAIRSSAEMLFPHYRELVERAFRSPIYNFYGSREINNLAAECPEEGRMHFLSTWRHIEITDEKGTPVPAGTPGHVTVTDCSNRVMGFIRYQNEDLAVLSKDLCPCGRPSPVLEKLVGRQSDIIKAPNGDSIHGEYFTHLFYGREDIESFQILQDRLDHLVVKYVPVSESAHQFVKELASPIKEKMGSDVEVETQSCSSIPVTASGKRRFTISEV